METDSYGSDAWLTTFCDTLFLLLTFFVLKFATMEPGTTSDKSETPKDSAYEIELAEQDFRRATVNTTGIKPLDGTNETQLSQELRLSKSAAGLVVKIASPILDADPSDLTFRATETLRSLGEIAIERGLAIDIRASVSPSTPPLARQLAFTAIRQIIDIGLAPSRISATGSFHAFTPEHEGYLLEVTLSKPAANR